LGLALLVKGSDIFVNAISRLAKRIGISDFIIGLTIVAIGTSVPELANTIISSVKGYNEIIIGNIVGSNVINITLLLGLSAILGNIKIKKEVIERDGYLVVFVSFLFFLSILFWRIKRLEGFMLLTLYAAYLLFLFKSKRVFWEQKFSEFFTYYMKFQFVETIKQFKEKTQNHRKIDAHLSNAIRKHRKGHITRRILRDSFIAIISLIALAQGSNMVVNQAVALAARFNISQTIIATVIIATGTTLPELTVSLTAARKGFNNIAVGNLLGSNIANILLVIGIGAVLRPIQVAKVAMFFSIPYLMFVSSFVLYLIKQKQEVSKTSGIILLVLYMIFMATNAILSQINFS
ncbi:MAG: calcium/sodium antiporter, partial [Nanoarchaeota archaeon]|nr:calcium/sodium antiporter [Nanoarchaeota archaeon]